MLSINIDDTLKKDFGDVVSELGMNTTTAVTLFMKQVVREHSLPLNLSLRSSQDQAQAEWERHINHELKRGYRDMEADKMASWEQVQEAYSCKSEGL